MLAGTVALAQESSAVTIFEDFQAFSPQTDTIGVQLPDTLDPLAPHFQVLDPSGSTVAQVSESLAASAGIGLEGTNKFLILNSSAGMTGVIDGSTGFLLIGDMPGAPSFTGPTAGPFGSFFSTPKNLTGGRVSADLREVTGAGPAKFRFLLSDINKNEIVTGTFPLTTGFATFSVGIEEFTMPLEGSVRFDFTRVRTLGFEFFTTPGSSPALSFNVDNVRIDTPAEAGALAKFSIAPIPSPQTAGVPFTIEITAQDAAGNTVTSFAGVVTLRAPGGLTPSSSGAFANGVRTETVQIATAGLGQRIEVTDGAGHTGVSNPFDVRGGSADRVEFVVQPGAGSAGSTLLGPPTVSVRDSQGNIVTESVPISVALDPQANPTGATLGGTLTRTSAGGLAVFDDLRVSLPGQGYRLVASAPGLLPATSAPFTVVEELAVPVTLNNTVVPLRPGVATSFATGDRLLFLTKSGIDIRFLEPSVLTLQEAATLSLQLASGFILVTTLDAQLALTVPQERISLVGSADARVRVSGGVTTLEVHSGVVDLAALGEAVPAGGRLTIDAAGRRTTELTLTQAPLVVTPEISTLIALANPTATEATVSLTARDSSGAVIGTAANPRTLTLPSGGAVHETATTLFGLAAGTIAIGTIEARTSALGVRGTSFVEVPAQGIAVGLGVTGEQASEVVLPEQPGENFLLVHNPGSTPLTLTLKRFDALGGAAGEVTLPLAAHGLAIRTTAELLGPLPESVTGRIALTAPSRFVARNVVVGPRQAAAFAGLGPAGVSATLRAPLVVELPGVATTTLVLLNASAAVPARVTLTLRDSSGPPIGTVVDTLLAGAKLERELRSLFPGLSAVPGFIGWLEIGSVPAAATGRTQLTGAVTLTDPERELSVSLPLVAGSQTNATAPRVENGGELISAVSVLNPSEEQPVTATVTLRGLDGSVVEGTTLRLAPLGLGLVPLPSPFTGSLQVTADGEGVVTGGLLGQSDHRFLAPLLPQ